MLNIVASLNLVNEKGMEIRIELVNVCKAILNTYFVYNNICFLIGKFM